MAIYDPDAMSGSPDQSSLSHERRFFLNDAMENFAAADSASFISTVRALSTKAGSTKREFRQPEVSPPATARTLSLAPPTSLTSTGVPQAIASTGMMPKSSMAI